MPRYMFQCACGVRFEASAKVEDHSRPQPCPDCDAPSPRWMPESVDGVFNPDMDGTPGPQNTGVAAVDMESDRAIGASAKTGWQVAENRLAEKKAIIKETGAEGEDLSRNPDGSYRVLDQKERGVHDRAQAINSLAMSTLSKRGQDSSSPTDKR